MNLETTAHYVETTDPLCLDAAAVQALLVDAPWRRFAVMGDSIAEGIGDHSPGYAPLPWAERVAEALRSTQPQLRYLNTGHTGATSAEVLETQLRPVLDFRPDLVHISCGANDLWGAEPDFDTLTMTLTTLFGAVRDSGAQITTLTIADVFVGARMRALRERMARLNDIVRDLAQRHDAVLVDLWNHPIRLRPNLLSADRIHFTMSGHAVLASEMVVALHERLTDRQ